MEEIKKESPQWRYNKKHLRVVGVGFNLPGEQVLYEYLQTKPNKSGYIKKLISDDFKKIYIKG